MSTVLLAWKLKVASKAEASRLAQFIQEFLSRLKWQLGKGLDVDKKEYLYLIEFQRHLTQASVEKPAVEARAKTLQQEYTRWSESGALTGDDEYEKRTGSKPG